MPGSVRPRGQEREHCSGLMGYSLLPAELGRGKKIPKTPLQQQHFLLRANKPHTGGPLRSLGWHRAGWRGRRGPWELCHSTWAVRCPRPSSLPTPGTAVPGTQAPILLLRDLGTRLGQPGFGCSAGRAAPARLARAQLISARAHLCSSIATHLRCSCVDGSRSTNRLWWG